jgi:cytochrome bd-type quinol oxidase subunit 2
VLCLVAAFSVQFGALPAEAATVTGAAVLALALVAMLVTLTMHPLDRRYIGAAETSRHRRRREAAPTSDAD